MRTLKTLAAFGVLLLFASGANAAVMFTLSVPSPGADGDSAQEVDLGVTLTDSATDDIAVLQLDWLLNGANVPLSAVELPAATSGTGPNRTCNNANNQFMCDFPNAVVVGSRLSNSVGDDWLWDAGTLADGTYNLGRFTFTAAAIGVVSIGNCEIPNGNLELVPCSSNSVVISPEPTTAALLGLGLFGLAVGGGRRD